MPTPLERLLAAAILIGYPIWDHRWGWPRMQRVLQSGRREPRVPLYHSFLIQEWVLALPILAFWAWSGRPWGTLGLTPPSSLGLAITAGLLVILLVLDAVRARAIARLTPAQIAGARKNTSAIVSFAPHTSTELRWFLPVALSAGFCEELIYRGFLVWALAPWLTTVGATIASLVGFTCAHAYLGRRHALNAGAVGACFALLTLVTGSLLPAMLLHTSLDALSGRASARLWQAIAVKPIGASP